MLLLAFVVTVLVGAPPPAQSSSPSKHTHLELALPVQRWTGDFDQMIRRRMIRVLVVHSKTFFFVDRGTPRGTAYDNMKAFEEEINKKLRTRHLHVHIWFIPVSRDELLPALVEGRGDIAVANLTITPTRRAVVDFTQPVLTGVNEIVVTGPSSPTIVSVDDLAGQDVVVRKSSSYYESLASLNGRFKAEGKPEMTLTPAPENLEDEDLLEMLNAGLVKLLVVDSHKAEFWQQIFPTITLHPEVVVRTTGNIAWAIRKESRKLKAELNAFIKTHGPTTVFGRVTFHRYLKETKYVKNATAEPEMRKFRALEQIFRKYGGQYAIDWLLMVAQGYQESRLDHSARSRHGAIGVMQVMPTTGKELNVGDIRQVEPNIHAGIKYVRLMIDEYYKDEPMDDLNKGLFAFASYNAGPRKLQELRQEAQKRGLNPNIWLNHVERVAAERIGRETVTYVSNIYKYYVVYRLLERERLERLETKRRFGQQRGR